MKALSSNALAFQVKLLKICGIYLDTSPPYENIHVAFVVLNVIIATFSAGLEYFYQKEQNGKVYVFTVAGCYVLSMNLRKIQIRGLILIDVSSSYHEILDVLLQQN